MIQRTKINCYILRSNNNKRVALPRECVSVKDYELRRHWYVRSQTSGTKSSSSWYKNGVIMAPKWLSKVTFRSVRVHFINVILTLSLLRLERTIGKVDSYSPPANAKMAESVGAEGYDTRAATCRAHAQVARRASRRTPCRPRRNDRQCKSKWRARWWSAAQSNASRSRSHLSKGDARAIMWSTWVGDDCGGYDRRVWRLVALFFSARLPLPLASFHRSGLSERLVAERVRTSSIPSVSPGAIDDRVTATREISRS